MPKRAAIQALGMAVADRVMMNSEFEEFLDTTDEWIKTRTGISQRRVSGPDEPVSKFATLAAREAIEKAGKNPEDVDMIVCATVTGDKIFPSTACLVQDALGCSNACAFDLGAACAGFIYSMDVAGSMIASGSVRNAVVIGADVLTRFVDWSDRSTCILFGDGAGAAFVEQVEGEDRGLVATVMKSDGAGAPHIDIEAGGSLYPFGSKFYKDESPYIYMAGREVYRFAVRAMGDSCCAVLDKAGLTPEDVDLFAPHQANFRIIKAAADRLDLPMEKVFVNVQDYGNMSAASIPVALYEAEKQGKLKRGDLVMTVGFGAGLVWGANLIRW